MSRTAVLAVLLALPLLTSPLVTRASPPGAVDPARLSETAKVLASDAFEGRAPGTPGEANTGAWLIDRF